MVIESDMINIKHSIFGVFKDKLKMENAIRILKSQNFSGSDISLLMPSREETQNSRHEQGTQAPQGAAIAASSGAALGVIFGWLAGTGALAISGVAPIVAAGPVVAAIGGAAIAGAIGGVAGALIGSGIPNYNSKKYTNIVLGGGILLGIHVNDEESTKLARAILINTGGKDVVSTTESIFDGEDRLMHASFPNVRSVNLS